MNELYHVIIFIIILFLYIQITHQYKRSEDLEIYEMDYTSNQYLQEVCELKQPILFEYESVHPEYFESIRIDAMSNEHDIKVRESSDFYNETENLDFIVLPFQNCVQLISTDTKAAYFTEMNDDFLTESGLTAELRTNDDLLKPTFTAQTKYDIIMGSKGVIMPLRYHTDYRRFICVNSGKIKVKMTPWKSHKYLYPIKDYDNYDFRSPINVWNTQPKYMHEMDKIKFLEFDVLAGHVIYIPPYWWYSIKFSDEPTLLTGFIYNSIMNIAANIPNYFLYFIQQQNIKTRVTKVLDIQSDNKTEEPTEEKTPIQESIDILTVHE